MNKKDKIKKYFIIISAIFLFGLISFFGTRLIHFYLKENSKKDENGEKVVDRYFSDVLENTINVSDTNGGLYIDGESYMYKYNATENYVWYSGHLWRILSVNEDKTITMITAESVALVLPKYEDNIYIDNFIEDFYQVLDKDYIVQNSYCIDTINDLKDLTCETKIESYISSLDLYTYNKLGGQKSFLNNETIFWLSNKMDDNYWYIDETGKAGIGTDNLAHNIRPIITIKEKVTLVKGSGTIDDPYIIKENNSSSLSQSVVGEYIKYNNSLWRILSVNESSIAALKMDCLNDGEECLKYKFGTNNIYLNSTIYKYLNETYYNSLENNDFLVKDKFYIGNYINYNYQNLKETEMEAYIGLPKIDEYYTQEYFDSYLITPNTFETIYTINEDGNYYLVKPSEEKYIYPVLNFDKTLIITNGDGTIDSPYELSR